VFSISAFFASEEAEPLAEVAVAVVVVEVVVTVVAAVVGISFVRGVEAGATEAEGFRSAEIASATGVEVVTAEDWVGCSYVLEASVVVAPDGDSLSRPTPLFRTGLKFRAAHASGLIPRTSPTLLIPASRRIWVQELHFEALEGRRVSRATAISTSWARVASI
jgi:hypothetical protein